jgi:hypothetical protein
MLRLMRAGRWAFRQTLTRCRVGVVNTASLPHASGPVYCDASAIRRLHSPPTIACREDFCDGSRERSRRVAIGDLIRYYLRLGLLGFGGPVALVGQMERELVGEYRDGGASGTRRNLTRQATQKKRGSPPMPRWP